MKIKKQTSIRGYQKQRKKIFLGKDDSGKKLYMGDFIKVYDWDSPKTPWMSQIHWTQLHGAFIDAHPASIAMNYGEWYSKPLYPFFEAKKDVSHLYYPQRETPLITPTIQKVTYAEYREWLESIEGKYDECRDANIQRREESKKLLEKEND